LKTQAQSVFVAESHFSLL